MTCVLQVLGCDISTSDSWLRPFMLSFDELWLITVELQVQYCNWNWPMSGVWVALTGVFFPLGGSRRLRVTDILQKINDFLKAIVTPKTFLCPICSGNFQEQPSNSHTSCTCSGNQNVLTTQLLDQFNNTFPTVTQRVSEQNFGLSKLRYNTAARQYANCCCVQTAQSLP